MFFSLDREGIVLNNGKAKPIKGLIPIYINYRSNLQRGDKANDTRVMLALDLIYEMNQQAIPNSVAISLVNATSADSLYFLADGVRVIIGKNTKVYNYNDKLRVFKNLLQDKLKQDMSAVEYIDLRYKKKAYVGYKR